jgi:hypothetical protein
MSAMADRSSGSRRLSRTDLICRASSASPLARSRSASHLSRICCTSYVRDIDARA